MAAESRLNQIWDQRNSGLYREAFDHYIQLSIDLCLPLDADLQEKFQALKVRNLKTDFIQSYLLLEVAFLRGKMQIDKSFSTAGELRQLLESESILPSAEFFMQLGLNHYIQSEDLKALDCFSQAISKSTQIKTKIQCQLNRILCLENLNYTFDKYLDEFTKDYSLVRGQSWAASLESQWLALLARKAFLQSDLDSLAKFCSSNIDDGQVAYFLAYQAKNPIFNFSGEEAQKEILLQRQLEHGEQWLSSFVLRTLDCHLINEDIQSDIGLSDQIERLYLWTWIWLSNPDSSQLQRLLLLLKAMIPQLAKHKISGSTYQMLENSLHWLFLLAGLSEKDAQTTLCSTQRSNQEPPTHLNFEKRFLNALFSLRNGDSVIFNDTLIQLNQSGIKHPEQFNLCELSKNLIEQKNSDFPLKRLNQSLLEFSNSNSRIRDGFFINSYSSEIKKCIDYQVVDSIQSVSFSKLIGAFANRQCCLKSELLCKCFEIFHYDSDIHDTKISNFLTRANRFFEGSAKFSTRSEKIFCEINESHFSFFGANTHSIQLQDSQLHQVFVKSNQDLVASNLSPIKKEAQKAKFSNWLSRHEISESLGVSKATTNRRIKEWLDNKMMVRQGVGKASRYKPLPPLDLQFHHKGANP